MSKVKVCQCGEVHAADQVRAMYRFAYPIFAYRALGVDGLFVSRDDAKRAVCPSWGAQ